MWYSKRAVHNAAFLIHKPVKTLWQRDKINMSEIKVNLSEEQIELASLLTSLQRRFVINLVGGDMSQRQAYIKAGGEAKTENAQDSSASVMLSNDKVDAFYQSLLNSATTKAVMTRTEALERLTGLGRKTDKDSDKMNAIKQLSTMQGWDSAHKIDLSSSDRTMSPRTLNDFYAEVEAIDEDE